MIVSSFDHPNNKEVNKALIQNVQGVADGELLDIALIKRTLGCSLTCVPLSFLFRSSLDIF